jgi:hypothetical protein
MADGDDSSAGMDVPAPSPEDTVEGSESLAEEVVFASGRDLRSHRTRQQIDRLLRLDKVQTHLHRVVVCGLYLVAISAAFMFFTVVVHYTTPLVYVTPEQLADIKQLLFSGAVGAAVSGLAKKYLGDGEGKL